MGIIELKEKLDEMGINPNYYSLNEGLYPDRLILEIKHQTTDVFYFDERGNKEKCQEFRKTEDACLCVFDFFKNRFKRLKR
jgi:hypothetical protein